MGNVKPRTWAPIVRSSAEAEAAFTKIKETLLAAGEVMDAAEEKRRHELTATIIGKYKPEGISIFMAHEPPDAPDYDNAPPEPDVLIIPERSSDPYWYDDPKDAATLDHYILARRALGDSMAGALLITGEAGYGKTMSVRKAVERLNEQGAGLTLFKMDCATVTDPGKWFGRREADADGTHFVPSDFWNAVEDGWLILLDDVGRLHPHIHNPIMSLLDGSETVTISDLNEVLHRHPKTVFIATTNEGTQYGGNHRMDWAMRERFGTTLRRKAPPPEEEVRILTSATNCDADAASVLVSIAEETRDSHARGDLRNAISTRTLVSAAQWVGFGMREWDALEITAVPEFDGDASGMVGAESDRQKVLGIMEGKLGHRRGN